MSTVDSSGNITPSTPAFPSAPLNDTITVANGVDTTVATDSTLTAFVDNANTLQSLFIGSAIEVDLGDFSSGSLRGTGSITGSTNADPTIIAPAFVAAGASVVDINGGIDVAFTSYGQLTVSAGERLDLEGDFSGQSAAAVTVAATGELDINSQNSAGVSTLTSNGTLKITAPSSRFTGTTVLGGTVLVQGDATNGNGSGTLVARTGNANGTYVAALDLRSATITGTISNLTLAQDAKISFGTGTTTVARFAVAGSTTALVPLDVVTVDGTLSITGDNSGAANPVTISQAEFTGTNAATGTGKNTIDFAVAAASGGASLQRQITVDAGTTLRNDATMRIGGQGSATSTIGATAAAAGSSFINGAGAQLTIAAGAALSVAAIQNAGAITVAGNATFLKALTNTGTIDVTAGTLSLAAAVQGTGTIAVESGATLSVDAADNQAIALRNGATLRLSQPSTFTGSIQAPPIGAKIDLAGISITAATVSAGSIAVTSSAGTFNLAATGLTTGAALALSSDGAGGTLLTIPAAALPHPVAFRFFDTLNGTQFLTTSTTETQMLQTTRPDLVPEGTGFATANQAIDPAAAPVFRFFDTTFGTHFYTSSTTERDSITATRPDLVSEGIGFYEHTTSQPGDVAVYRFFETTNGTHFYTSSTAERATIAATRPDLTAEGVSFYAPST